MHPVKKAETKAGETVMMHSSAELVPLSIARKTLGDLVSRVLFGNEYVLIARNSKPAAALVPIEALQLLQEIEKHHDLVQAKAALEKAKREGTLSFEEVEKELFG